MADLVTFHQYYTHRDGRPPSTVASRVNGHSHKRSLSSEPRSTSAVKSVTKTKSANDLTRYITNRGLPNSSSADPETFFETNFNTIKDPRLTHSPGASELSSSPSHHPDLNSEVAALSVKLVQAINNQTTLDDDLAATRQDLRSAQTRIRTLELENESYRRDVDEEILIKRADADYEISRVTAALAEERAQRTVIERDKKAIEQELETLTAALFEEANKMVAAAKLEREAVEKKNEQLRSQIKDTELLLASHQDQLSELKAVMQGLCKGRDEAETYTSGSTVPPSPAATQQPLSSSVKTLEIVDVLKEANYTEELIPGPSTAFPRFIKTVYRTDTTAYEDFRELFYLAASSKPPSRVTSGSYVGLNVMGLASLAGHTGGGFGSNAPSPVKSQTHSPSGSLPSPHASSPRHPLKETRFYKRVIMEDIDPALRLDIAPGISWLTRRNVMSGICEGSLIVEPLPPSTRALESACSICGEHRSGPANERAHCLRTSDHDTAQRYPLCTVCLEKVRASCEFAGYLRLILDGYVHANDPEEEKDAWEETIRLRERLFWARIAGGVVPLFSTPNSADKYLREVVSRASIDGTSVYSKGHSAAPSLFTGNTRPQTGDGNDDCRSVSDDYHSAASQSSASSIVDATHVSRAHKAEREVPAKAVHSSEFELPSNHTGSVVSEHVRLYTAMTDDLVNPIATDNNAAYAAESYERQVLDPTKDEVPEQVVE